ncbi:MAG: hypothetical protein KF746_21800 [Chitinophagaceae bacterium]|nr:hypothetical protein [Chitinophagaceae bacterium]
MKAFLNFAAVCFFSVIVCSCQKELSLDSSLPGGNNNNNNNNQLLGSWKFVNLSASTESVAEAVFFGEKVSTVTKYNTVTENNKGSITFDGSNAKVSNLSYEIDTELTVTDYLNGVKGDEFKVPFKFAVPPVSSSSKYQIIGSDSLYLPEGSFFSMPDGSGQTQGFTEPSGAKFSVNGNTLLLTTSVARDTSIYDEDLDVLYKVTQKAGGIMKFERQ